MTPAPPKRSSKRARELAAAAPSLEAIRREKARRATQRDLIGFCENVLGMKPWKGVNGYPGQYEVLEAIQQSVCDQLDGKPNVPYIILVEAPHGVGKTYGIEAPVIAWFYHAFAPSVIQSTANSAQQVRDALWKDIRGHVATALERGHDVMPGLMPKEMRAERSANHFAMGFSTSDAGGMGTERVQGQHNKYHLWVFDEAEGIGDFMYDAVKRQFTGEDGVHLWLLIANPKTDTSTFQSMKQSPFTIPFRMSLLGFPNVWNGTSEVPHGTGRSTFNAWIEDRRTFGCEVVYEHDESRHTFTVPWDVPKADGTVHPAGTIFAPKRGFLYGALGIPPSGGLGDTFISGGRIEAALGRNVDGAPTRKVQVGVDVARYGDDSGVIYSLHARKLRFETAIQGRAEETLMTRTAEYVQEVAKVLRAYAEEGATEASVRVDGTGGYGGGIVDALITNEDLRDLFPDGYLVHDVQFGHAAEDDELYRDLVTEMYALADEVLGAVRLDRPGSFARRDLTGRKFGYVTVGDLNLKKLEKKDDFKKRNKGQSPDEGDAIVLALAPERLFALEDGYKSERVRSNRSGRSGRRR